ncbi:hypothetical protein GCM10020255_044360 [Rhodococcus baikonurensis]
MRYGVLHATDDLVCEFCVHDENGRLGIANDVLDFRCGEVGVDRNEVQTTLHAGQSNFVVLRPIRQQARGNVAFT